VNISRKVRQWQAVGLIDEATAERIDERPIVLYTVGGLGALTIGIGIISVELSIHRGSRPQIRRIIIDGEPLP